MDQFSIITINGLAGNDRLFNVSSLGLEMRGGQGNDVLVGGEAGDFLSGDEGIDQVFGMGGDDLIFFAHPQLVATLSGELIDFDGNEIRIEDLVLDGGEGADRFVSNQFRVIDERDSLSSQQIDFSEPDYVADPRFSIEPLTMSQSDPVLLTPIPRLPNFVSVINPGAEPPSPTTLLGSPSPANLVFDTLPNGVLFGASNLFSSTTSIELLALPNNTSNLNFEQAGAFHSNSINEDSRLFRDELRRFKLKELDDDSEGEKSELKFEFKPENTAEQIELESEEEKPKQRIELDSEIEERDEHGISEPHKKLSNESRENSTDETSEGASASNERDIEIAESEIAESGTTSSSFLHYLLPLLLRRKSKASEKED